MWKCLHVHVSSAACWTKQRYQLSFPTSGCNWQLASSDEASPVKTQYHSIRMSYYSGPTSANPASSATQTPPLENVTAMVTVLQL
jgi:hypothetical protein